MKQSLTPILVSLPALLTFAACSQSTPSATTALAPGASATVPGTAALPLVPWVAPVGPPLWKIPTQVSYNGPPIPGEVGDGVRLYQPYLDQLSWQIFMAVNWPACTRPGCQAGDPDKARWIGAGGDAPTVWEQWMNASDVFRSGGAEPLPWGDEDVPPACKGKLKHRHEPVFTLGNETATAHNNPALQGSLELDARQTGPLVDQRRRWARFESYLNKTEYDYLVANKLYSVEGQKAFARASKTIDFPPALDEKDPEALSIEIKAVWKILDEKDDRTRYHVAEGLFIDAAGTCQPVPVALASMHVMTKMARSPMRVWSTFEHVDNLCRFLPVERGKKLEYQYTSGAFCNAECKQTPGAPGCTPNQAAPEKDWRPPPSPLEPGTVLPTQVERVRPLPLESVQINSLLWTFLGGIDPSSVWKNYELVSTQWVMPLVANLNNTIYREQLNIKGAGPAPQYIPRHKGEKACDADPFLLGRPDTNCSGLVVPAFLANTLVETYDQAGSSCLGCHQMAQTKVKTSADFSFLLLRAR